MNYKVYNTDTCNWMTYRRDCDGHYSVVHEGLPRISGYCYDEASSDCYIPYCRPYPRWLYTEVRTKTRKVRTDVFDNGRRLIYRRYRPTYTYRTEIY